jgi:alpha-glucoside transport system permease protein
MAEQTSTAQGLPPPGNWIKTHGLRLGASAIIALIVIYLVRWSVDFMMVRDAPRQFLITWYSRLGMQTAAEHLAAEGLPLLTSKLMTMTVALVLGVAGMWALFWVANDLVARLPERIGVRLLPYVFVGPATLMLLIYLVYPILNTLYLSVTEDVLNIDDVVPETYWNSNRIIADMLEGSPDLTFTGYLLNLDLFEVGRVQHGDHSLLLVVRPDTLEDRRSGETRRVFTIQTIGLQNYAFALTSDEMRIAFRNNLLWLIVGTGISVAMGLLIAALVDRIRLESVAKSLIFMPLAISFVGASVIWRFMYAWKPPGVQQIGLLNAILTLFGNEPIPFIIQPPVNTLALIVIMIWLQTGFCMVVLSAALKGVDHDILEAARIDGADEFQLFFMVIIPMIRGSIITVATTVFISILKVFDIVYVMTNGKFQTEVIANRMFVEMFTFRNFGRASSLAAILLIVVVPIMVLNIRNLRRQGVNQ